MSTILSTTDEFAKDQESITQSQREADLEMAWMMDSRVTLSQKILVKMLQGAPGRLSH